MVGLPVNRTKLYFFIVLSRIIYSFLFCCLLAIITFFLFLITGLPIQLGEILVFFLEYFLLGLFFLSLGILSATYKKNSVRFSVMFIGWFLSVFVIPFLTTEWTRNNATSILSVFVVEKSKKEVLHNFEKKQKEKGNEFKESKRATKDAQRTIIHFWENDFSKMQNEDQNIITQMKYVVTSNYTASALFPATNFLCTITEISGRGYNSLIEFCQNAIDKTGKIMWYYITNEILSKNNIKDAKPFISGDANIYYSKSSLPDNFRIGDLLTLLWIATLIIWGRFRFYRLLKVNAVTGSFFKVSHDIPFGKSGLTSLVYPPDTLTRNDLVYCTTWNPETEIIIIPPYDCIPGDMKMKWVFELFGLPVPEQFMKESETFTHDKDFSNEMKAKIILLIVTNHVEKLNALGKKIVIILDNFLVGLDDSFFDFFLSKLKLIKTGNKVYYFSNTLVFKKDFFDDIIPTSMKVDKST